MGCVFVLCTNFNWRALDRRPSPSSRYDRSYKLVLNATVLTTMVHVEYLLFFVFALCRLSTGCKKISLYSEDRGSLLLTKLPKLFPGSLGRTSYFSVASEGVLPAFLFFITTDEHSGNGRWILSGELGSTNHVSAFVGSSLIALQVVFLLLTHIE